ncbi:vWA domain-containing protein [Arenibacter echinorum]|uniref:von Willebrand factor type A domain-containing protein n=1 Tax=Arenibacter echinorum TaxID=440515 RepID=A0A327R4S3_9FLAO|nr:vWA domain-containing protein [Arenibacter echinorum]RAJ11215.1 von Willebrand factor type A domain-containing protein [Arenibacter echinorum]
MKNVKQILVLGAIALGMGQSFGNDFNNGNNLKDPLLTEMAIENSKPANNMVRIALLLDTSNSMDGLINQAKAQLWDIVNKFTHAKCGNDGRPQLQIALYQYGNDNLSSREGYIQQVLGFSSDLDEISEKLFSLSTNGGEEYCGQVIQTSLSQLDWGKNPDQLKMIFIAGNEPFTQGKLNYKDAVANAKEKDVIVNTIFCGAYEQGINTGWKNGAQLTGGEYMAIDHNREVVHIATPYDDVIIKLNSRLNKTYISYGALGAAKIQQQSAQDSNAMEMEEAVAVKRAVSKSSRLYTNSSWDLVDASKADGFDIDKVKKEELPMELKEKSKTEIASYIEGKKKERSDIQNEIQDLNSKREAYIASQQKDNEKGELENAMLTAIQKQAAKKNYRWE